MRIGVDLGGTKIEAVVMDRSGSILLRRRISSPSHDYHTLVAAIVRLVNELEAESGHRCRVGIGTPGSLSPTTRLMKNCNSTVLNGKPLQSDLEQGLNREVRMANDANCFALSEAVDGAAAGRHSVFGVILGTGVGGGLVIGGSPVLGRNRLGGEWGHNPMPEADEARDCYCGMRDCIETYLSGGGLLESARQLLPDLVDARELSERADRNDSMALTCIEQYAGRLSRALATVINIVDPEVIVLGGGVSNISRLYPLVEERLAASCFGGECSTAVIQALHGDSSGVRGAAWLWPESDA